MPRCFIKKDQRIHQSALHVDYNALFFRNVLLALDCQKRRCRPCRNQIETGETLDVEIMRGIAEAVTGNPCFKGGFADFGNGAVGPFGKVREQTLDDVLCVASCEVSGFGRSPRSACRVLSVSPGPSRWSRVERPALEVSQLALGECFVGGFERDPFLLAALFEQSIVYPIREFWRQWGYSSVGRASRSQ